MTTKMRKVFSVGPRRRRFVAWVAMMGLAASAAVAGVGCNNRSNSGNNSRNNSGNSSGNSSGSNSGNSGVNGVIPTVEGVSPSTSDSSDSLISRLVGENLDAELAYSPSLATWLGSHSYDDRLDDLRPETIVREVARLRSLLAQLRRVERSKLDANAVRDLDLLDRRTELGLFELTEMRAYERNPIFYADSLDGAIDELVADAGGQAALAERSRVMALTARLYRVRRFLDDARANLRGSTPSELTLKRASDLLHVLHDFCQDTLLPSVQPTDARLLDEFRSADADALRALEDFRSWMNKELHPPVGGKLRFEPFGRERLFTRLRLSESFEQPPETLLIQLEAALKEARARTDEAARQLSGGKPGVDLQKMLEDDHAKPDELLPQARAQVAAVLEFASSQKLLPLGALSRSGPTPLTANPDGGVPAVSVVVAEMPAHLWGFLRLSIARPLETRPREPVIYVDAVDKSWSERTKIEHLKAFNKSQLMLRIIHEVAGHLVLAERNRRAPTTQSKITLSPGFVEGWAHYVERAFLESGFAAGDLKLRYLIERAALLRAGRAVAAVRLHALGGKLDDVVRMFSEDVQLERAEAEREAERAAIDPMILVDCLGRLRIERRRDEWLAAHAGATLGDFHREFLSRGAAW